MKTALFLAGLLPLLAAVPAVAEDPFPSLKTHEIKGYLTAGNGSVYTTGHANTMFDEHRKHTVKGGQLVETKQPFLYVGIEGKAKRDLTIHSTPAQKEAVAAIPKGTAMTVLLADGADHYLIKTAFGLVGWVTIPADSQEATVIEGLFFAGD